MVQVVLSDLRDLPRWRPSPLAEKTDSGSGPGLHPRLVFFDASAIASSIASMVVEVTCPLRSD